MQRRPAKLLGKYSFTSSIAPLFLNSGLLTSNSPVRKVLINGKQIHPPPFSDQLQHTPAVSFIKHVSLLFLIRSTQACTIDHNPDHAQILNLVAVQFLVVLKAIPGVQDV